MGVLGRSTCALAALCAAVGALAGPAAAQEKAPVLLAAGDIANCNSSGDEATSDILLVNEGVVATLGDNAQLHGAHEEFANCYHPSWGRVKDRTRPSAGNHDYGTPGAAGYFGYFGPAAGDPSKGYYSYDLGEWHIVVLNSNCWVVACHAGSAQERWLREDLAASSARCTLAYWHHARFSGRRFQLLETEPFWKALYEDGADVVLSGHEHIYERFAPQTPIGDRNDAHGIRQFTVGTGGFGHSSLARAIPLLTSEVVNNDTFGVLELTLRPGGYDWAFLPEAGKAFGDAGSERCHDAPPDVTPPTVTFSGPSTGEIVRGRVALSADASDDTALQRVEFLVDQTVVARVTAPPYALSWNSASYEDGQRILSARAVDVWGNATSSNARAVVIDNALPETTITRAPSGVVAWRSPSFVFSSEPGATFECALDGAGFAPCSSPVEYSGLSEGRHRFHVRARDAAGNLDPTPASRTWTIDVTKPQTRILSVAIRAARGSIRFAFESNEPGATFECSLDKEAWTACQSPRVYAGLPSGAHALRVRARDLARNPDWTPASRTWSLTIADESALVSGSDQAEVIVGTSGDDVIRGLGGGDVLAGGEGRDLLDGGPGRDRIGGGGGDDTMRARDGEADALDGGSGRDRARSDRRLDSLVGVEARF